MNILGRAIASTAAAGLVWYLWSDYIYCKYDDETDALIFYRVSMPKMPPA